MTPPPLPATEFEHRSGKGQRAVKFMIDALFTTRWEEHAIAAWGKLDHVAA